MARAIALRGSTCWGETAWENRATVRNAVNLWPYKTGEKR